MQHGVHAIIAALFAFSFGVPEETSADALPLPASDANFVSAHFSGSANCGACHNGLRDPEGNDAHLLAVGARGGAEGVRRAGL